MLLACLHNIAQADFHIQIHAFFLQYDFGIRLRHLLAPF